MEKIVVCCNFCATTIRLMGEITYKNNTTEDGKIYG